MLSKVDIAAFVEISRSLAGDDRLSPQDADKIVALFQALQSQPRVIADAPRLGAIGMRLVGTDADCVTDPTQPAEAAVKAAVNG